MTSTLVLPQGRHDATGIRQLSRRKKILAAAIELSLAGLLATPVCANESVDQNPADMAAEVVIVTGTRIQKANLISVSPITQVDAEDLRLAGVTRVEDLLKNLPQLYSVQNSTASNDATGTATLDLRNLGPQRTLVLVDGRRLPQGSPWTDGVADINQIPGALIDRVEVLTGGASAAYGSDAMAGVVNFFLVDDFEGVKLEYQFSQYSHDNSDGRMERLLEQAGEPAPGGTARDGDTHDLSLMIGHNFTEARGNITAYATYRDIDPVVASDRLQSACPLEREDGEYYCGGSLLLEEGLFTDFGVLESEQGVPSYDYMVQGSDFVPWDGRTYNWAPMNYFQRSDERWTAGLLADYAINEHVEAYTQLMYADDQTTSQVAPIGSIFFTDSLNCGNPLMSAQQFEALCGDYGLGPEDYQVSYVGRRSVEGDPRRHDIQHTSFRGVFGLRGDIDETWRYDLYLQYAEVDLDATYKNDMLVSHIQKALDITADPATGEAVCQSVLDGSDPACVPWNIFQTGGVTQQALDYLSVPASQGGSTDQTIVSGYVAANLQHYGVKSPFAETAVDIILGAEYREENLEQESDEVAASGDIAGWGFAALPLEGGYDVSEIYTELSIPLVEARPLVESLSLDLGYRYSSYSLGDTTDTYKIAGAWVPVDTLRFRTSYQRAVRAPSVPQLFTVGGVFPFFEISGGDPCAGATPARSASDCARTGVTAAQYGSIPSPQEFGDNVNGRWGGNPDLEPEKSDTWSMGFQYSPAFIEGLSLSLDWYEIEIDDAIAFLDPDSAFFGCLDTGEPWFCQLVNREQDRGTLWLSEDAYIDTRWQNLSSIRTSGYDFLLDYSLDIGAWGSVEANNILTWLDEWEAQQHPSEEGIDCSGVYGYQCGPMPELRNNLRLTWATPWHLSLSMLWRYIDEIESLNPTYEDLDAKNYFDLSLLWQPTDRASLRLGINNLFDEDPPIALGWGPPAENGNTRPGLYDALGQYWFAGLTVSF